MVEADAFVRPASEASAVMSAVVVDPRLHKLLYGAIQNKRLIRFRYKNKERIVEPHDYGVQKGIVRLLSWQTGGQSSTALPGWRWFDVGDMQNVEMLERLFSGNRTVSGKHHQWEEIFIRVEPPRKVEG